ncbi:tyrosine-type recombinase/integrase [Luteimonas sp. MC1782]|uniref:tyrosine-type recombinase/integrase n=1 Tax=Luteimonas sp. MC1782 TaxID=2760305 RepID=UPI0016037873|nr:site-specific integrase [Luteimonas sp. MC1782]MBB1472607.1 tyrosine-type recombinase/integrase [Luteimonas sp. MC1782]
MAKAKFTARMIEEAGRGEYWDSDVTGFKVIVTRAGRKSFAIEGRLHGRKVKHTFSRVGTMTLEQARRRAKELLFEIVQGRDPAATALAARREWTLKELVREYKTGYFPSLRPATQQHYTDHFDRFILPEMGKRKVSDIAAADALRLFRSVETRCRRVDGEKVVRSGKTTANRVIATLSSLLSESVRLGLRTDNPCRAVRRNQESKRERYLSDDETARLLAACDASPHLVPANLIRLLVFTGARKGETLAAKWSEFDLAHGIWTKPSHHTKQNRTHTVPLSQAALALLRDMRQEAERAGAEEWLFPGARTGRRLVSPKRAVRRIFEQAALTSDVCLHTLRHSFAARVVSSGHGLHATGKLLGHTQAATTHRYAHLEHDTQRRALADSDQLLNAAVSVLISRT